MSKKKEKTRGNDSLPRGQKRHRDGSPVERPAGKSTKFGDAPKSTEELRKPQQRPSQGVKQSSTKPIGGKPLSGPTSTEQPRRPINQHAQVSQKRAALEPVRRALPIWPRADSIRASLREANILVLTGETGSGKSTQVPQFLSTETWCTKCIAITQPRVVAATSLARRVAEEMGSQLGRVGKVGYSVRFDNSTGPNTKIKFLTEGMLIQEMLRDPTMKQYSAVVVDEVHERSVNVDLILGFLRNLVSGVEHGPKRQHPLKVVVMSATADVDALVKFFEEGQAPSPEEKGEDAESKASWSGISDDEDTKSDTPPPSRVSKCFVEGRQYPIKTIYLPTPTQDWIVDALKLIFKIHYGEPLPGDILVFLTGKDTIETLEKLVNDYASAMDKSVPKLLALPLFAALPQHAQQLIFEPTPPRTRKVILATNIAEASVTVPGVRFVIDSGKSKIKHFRNQLGLDSLLVKPVSKSAAIQRQGRAGREAPGHCYRLYTEEDYNGFQERTAPEILRCDLSHALLTMKARGVKDLLNFPFLDRPSKEALLRAGMQLSNLGAINKKWEITEMGQRMAKLPLTPTHGRVLVEAAKPGRDCLPEAIDIISALSVENIFLTLSTEEENEKAEAARRELYRREGDHLTLLVTVQRYAEEHSDRKAWCQRRFVSWRAMQSVMNIRKQLRQQCQTLGLAPKDMIWDSSLSAPSEAISTAIMHCLLRGFVLNTARIQPDKTYKTMGANQTVAIHPSSVMKDRKTECIVYTEYVFTTKPFARGVSAVQLDWVDAAFSEMKGMGGG